MEIIIIIIINKGNEHSEYDTVQSTALVDGRRVIWRLNAVPKLLTSESGSNDAGITCVS